MSLTNLKNLSPQVPVSVYLYGMSTGGNALGSWSVVYSFDGQETFLSGVNEKQNALTMVLTSAVQALESLPSHAPVCIYVESQYLKDGLTLWCEKWKKNGWKTVDKKPIKNQELWQKLVALVESFKNLTWVWVSKEDYPQGLSKAEVFAKSAIISQQSQNISSLNVNSFKESAVIKEQIKTSKARDVKEDDNKDFLRPLIDHPKETVCLADFFEKTKDQDLIIYTDGACSGNPGPGGWGVVFLTKNYEATLYGGESHTTNNRMEMTASLEALKNIPDKGKTVHVFTDSNYLKDGVTKWMPRWKINGWKTADKKPVSNQDLWIALDACLPQHTINWHWVRGHNNDPYNEKADSLARGAILALRMR